MSNHATIYTGVDTLKGATPLLGWFLNFICLNSILFYLSFYFKKYFFYFCFSTIFCHVEHCLQPSMKTMTLLCCFEN